MKLALTVTQEAHRCGNLKVISSTGKATRFPRFFVSRMYVSAKGEALLPHKILGKEHVR